MPDEATRNDNIEQRAGDLLQAHARHASAETAAAIDVFASQSSAHADALRYAQMLQKLAPTLNCETSGPREAVQLWLEVHWTRWIGPQTTWKWLAAVPILIVCVFALQLLQPASEELPPAAAIAQAPIDYTTRWHETREITLSDGSKTWLDWQTSISESFDGTARRVTVHRGKVAFDVVPDAARPFIVQAAAVTTEVTGTEFVVHFLTDSDIEVAVLEGQVKVASTADQSTVLNAAEVVLARGTTLGKVTNRSSDDMLRWREGLLIYRERPLRDVLNELAGYTRFAVDVSRLEDSGVRVSGVFYKDQAKDALFTVIEGQNLAFTQSANRLIIEPRPLH